MIAGLPVTHSAYVATGSSEGVSGTCWLLQVEFAGWKTAKVFSTIAGSWWTFAARDVHPTVRV